VAGIGSPRQCRSGIDEAGQPCHTGPAPVPRCARVGLDTGMNLAVRTGVGPVSSAVSCSRSSTASRFPRHPPAEPHIPGASALALRAPSDAPESEPHETSQSRRAEQQSRRTAVRRRHPMSDSDRHSHGPKVRVYTSCLKAAAENSNVGYVARSSNRCYRPEGVRQCRTADGS
jgi:hypothetical protein